MNIAGTTTLAMSVTIPARSTRKPLALSVANDYQNDSTDETDPA
jgi:hypothetical protein